MNYEHLKKSAFVIEEIKDYKLNSNLVRTDVRVQPSMYNSNYLK